MVERDPVMPSDVSPEISRFDRFADSATRLVSRAYFFAFCVVLVVIWAPSFFLLRNVDTWQLIINTITTIITFLMVALLQNSQMRSDQAIQHKLNALARALSDLMGHIAEAAGADDLHRDRRELHDAIGLEFRESTTDNTARESEPIRDAAARV